MSVIRVNFLPEFEYGYDAVLLTMDGAGVDTFRAALSDALDRGSSLLEHDGVTHEFRIQPGTADIDLDKTHVVWRLDLAWFRERGSFAPPWRLAERTCRNHKAAHLDDCL
ncbi:MAG: hypothetical protein WBR28_19455 [Mycobacterium sp.]